jgi:uncharacterized membrane protein
LQDRPSAGQSRLAAWRTRPELFVATIGLVAGLGFAFLTPPLAGYDEAIHFLRADQVSHGGLIATHRGHRLGGSVPSGLRADLARLLTDGLLARRDHTAFLHHLGDRPPGGPKVFLDFPSSGVYSPVPYAPAAFFMTIGRTLGVSTLVLVYLGRLGCLLATLGLLCLAVRRMPTGRWMLAMVALLPVTVFQAAMLSADGITIALALLVLALALDLAATRPGAVTRGRLVETAIATIALGYAKPPYILFASALLIPSRRHRGRVGSTLAAAVGAGFVATASWGAYASRVYVAPRLPAGFAAFGIGRFTPFTHVDPRRQERFVVHHPWLFVRAIGRTLSSFGPDLAREALTQVPLWRLPLLAVIAAAVIVSATSFASDPPPVRFLGWRSRALLSAIGAATFLALMLLAYVGWNAVGSPRIEAVQGRYLLPLVPLLLLVLPSRKAPATVSDPWRAGATLALAAASTLLLATVWFGLRSHFY